MRKAWMAVVATALLGGCAAHREASTRTGTGGAGPVEAQRLASCACACPCGCAQAAPGNPATGGSGPASPGDHSATPWLDPKNLRP